jgi:hypothetical protein
MNAYFCSKTGVRIVAPGVSKAVDPTNGQDEFSDTKPEKGSKSKESTASADAGSDTKPEKGSK